MRFMVFMIPKVYQPGQKLEANFAPPAEAVAKMTQFNEELKQAGALIALDGLQPPANGARVTFTGGKAMVTEGASAGGNVVGGYWMLRFNSKREAIEWVKRCPAQDGDAIEIRPVFEMEDYPAEVQAAAKGDTK